MGIGRTLGLESSWRCFVGVGDGFMVEGLQGLRRLVGILLWSCVDGGEVGMSCARLDVNELGVASGGRLCGLCFGRCS